MRRGLLKEVGDAFDLAIDMCGSHHPEEIEADKARLRALRREVLGHLRQKLLVVKDEGDFALRVSVHRVKNMP